MKYKIMLLLILTATVISCKKTTNVRVVDPASAGKLSYKIVDDAGKGLPNVKVSIYDNKEYTSGIFYDPSSLIDTLITDNNGVASFSGLAAANYLVVADSPAVNKVKYDVREFVQVVAGIDKEKVTKASDFSGTLRITLKSNLDYSTFLTNTGVAAIPYNPANIKSIDIKSVVNAAAITGITNAQGFVTLKIPSNVNYYLVAYSLDKGEISSWYDVYLVQKDTSTPVSLFTSPYNQ